MNTSGHNIKKKSTRIKFWMVALALAIMTILCLSYLLYKTLFAPNFSNAKNEHNFSLYIPEPCDKDQLIDLLDQHEIQYNHCFFSLATKLKELSKKIKPGHYLISDNMSNKDFINLLNSGRQTPITIIFNNIRDIYSFSGKISKQLNFDSIELLTLLSDSSFIKELDLTPEQLPSIFIPNSYEFFWTTTPEKFVIRMHKEHQKFWNDTRRKKSKAIGLTPFEVSNLASIVEKETQKNDEKNTIAGVYLNRLKHNWKLQADPTLIYSHGDHSIRRVLNNHKVIDSPYNTYKYHGLPPGPICFPSISSIDAVLNPEKHDYFFFCAKEDFSGYHNFAKTLQQHKKNACAYQNALNKKQVFK